MKGAVGLKFFNHLIHFAPAASDCEALENLRRLALAVQVPAPKQLELVLAELDEVS